MTSQIAKEWTLPENLHHMWEIRGPENAVEIAEALHQMAESALQKASIHLQLSRSMPALGAYTAAGRMLETALNCLSQVQNMPPPKPPQLLRPDQDPSEAFQQKVNRLAERIVGSNQRILEALQSSDLERDINPQTLANTGGWHAYAQHRIIRQEWSTNAFRQLEEQNGKRRHPYPGHAQERARLIYQVAIWPTENDYDGNDFPLLQEPDPTTGAQARRADHDRDELLVKLLTPMNRTVPTNLSPAASLCPQLAQELQSILLPPTGSISGLSTLEPQPGGPEEEQTVRNTELAQGSTSKGAMCLAWIGFMNEGTRHFKAVFEPYPAGFHKDLAQSHITQLALTLRQRMEAAPKMQETDHFIISSMAAEGASAQSVHDLQPEQVTAVAQAARQHGMSQAEAAQMVRRTAQDNPMALLYLSLNFGQDVRLESEKTATRIIESAASLGASRETLLQLATAMGYRPSEMGLEYQPGDQQTHTTIARHALAQGMPLEIAELLPEPPELPDHL